jgi:hypothetical protein
VKLRAVGDPLPEPPDDDHLHSRPPSNGRFVGVKVTVANQGPGVLSDYGLGLRMVDSAKREARGWLLIGWDCEGFMTDPLLPHTVRDDCDAFQVRSGRRPARLMLTKGSVVWGWWTLR